MEGHVVNGLLALLPVSCDLLNTSFAVEVPQTQGAVVTWGGGAKVRMEVRKSRSRRRKEVKNDYSRGRQRS